MNKPISFASEIPDDFYKQLTDNREKYKDKIIEEHISMNVIPTGVEQPQTMLIGQQAQTRIVMQMVFCCFMVVNDQQ